MATRKLIIAGAGGSARETIQYLKEDVPARWQIQGFLCDLESDIKEKTRGDYDVIGTIVDWQPSEDEDYIVAITAPAAHRKVVEILRERGANIITWYPQNASISEYATIGAGVFLMPGADVGPNAVVEDYVYSQAGIPHDCVIHSYATLYRSYIGGGVEIGENALVCSGSTILPKIKIGKNAIVGAGSVVIKNVPDGVTVFGNPAKRIE